MIDGHEVNRFQDQGSSGEVPNMFLDKVERIEIIRGPGGVIYGPSAFSGILNIITSNPSEVAESRVRLSAGSFEQYKAEVSLHEPLTDTIDFDLYAGIADSNGQSVPISGDEFTAEEPSLNNIEELDEPAFELYSKLLMGNLKINMRYFDIDPRLPSNSPSLIKYRSGFVEATYDSFHLTDNLFLRPRVYIDAVELKRNAYEAGEVRTGTELRLTYSDPLLPYSAVNGLEFRQDFFGRLPFSSSNATDSFAGNTTSVPTLFNDRFQQSSVGLYSQHDYYLTDELKFTVGLRFDDRSQSDSSLAPRGGIVYLPTKKTALKLLFQSAQLPPTSESIGPSAIKDDSGRLDNERIDSIEGIWVQDIGYGTFETSLFFNRIRDMIVIAINDLSVAPRFGLNDVPLFRFTNAADIETFGGELLYRFSSDQFQGQISHSTLFHSDVSEDELNVILVTTDGNDINGYADNISKIDLNFVASEDINFNINAVVDWGKDGVLRRNGVTPEAAEINSWERRIGDWAVATIDPLFYLNSTISIENILLPNSRILITGYNLTDERGPDYNNSGYTEQTTLGRSIGASFLIDF